MKQQRYLGNGVFYWIHAKGVLRMKTEAGERQQQL
jgi:hypothetical protein